MNTRTTKCRITVRIAGDKVRLTVEERGPGGKLIPLERPWGAADLLRFKKAAKAVGLLARGVGDLEEIRRTVNAAPAMRRSRSKKNSTPDVQKHPDIDVALSA